METAAVLTSRHQLPTPRCSRSVQLRPMSPSSPTYPHDTGSNSACLQSFDRIKSWGTAMSTASFSMQCSGLPTPLYSTLSPTARALQAFSMGNGSNNSNTEADSPQALGTHAQLNSTPRMAQTDVRNTTQGCPSAVAAPALLRPARRLAFLDEECLGLTTVLEDEHRRVPALSTVVAGAPLDCRHTALDASAIQSLSAPSSDSLPPSHNLDAIPPPSTPTNAAVRQWQATSLFYDPLQQHMETPPLYLGTPPTDHLHRLSRSSCGDTARVARVMPDPMDALLQALTPINTAPLKIQRSTPAAPAADGLEDFKLFRRQPLAEHVTCCSPSSEPPGVAACNMYACEDLLSSCCIEQTHTPRDCNITADALPFSPLLGLIGEPSSPVTARCSTPRSNQCEQPCSLSTPKKVTAAAPPSAPRKQAAAAVLPRPGAAKRALWTCPTDGLQDMVPSARPAPAHTVRQMDATPGLGLYPLAMDRCLAPPPARALNFGFNLAGNATVASAPGITGSSLASLGTTFLNGARGLYPVDGTSSSAGMLSRTEAPALAAQPTLELPASIPSPCGSGNMDILSTFNPYDCIPLDNNGGRGSYAVYASSPHDAALARDASPTKSSPVDDFTFAAAAFDSIAHPLSLSPVRVTGELSTGPLCFDEDLVSMFIEGLKNADNDISSSSTNVEPAASDTESIGQSLGPSSVLYCADHGTNVTKPAGVSSVASSSVKPLPTSPSLCSTHGRDGVAGDLGTCCMTAPHKSSSKRPKFWSRMRCLVKSVGKAF